MKSSNKINTVSESFMDIKIGFSLLKENWKAFLGSEIFAIIPLLIFILFLPTFQYILRPNLPFIPRSPFGQRSEGFNLLTYSLIIIILGLILFYAFISCQFGLAYDVMTSGDMFAEFNSSFTYFKRHWLSYIIISIIIGIIPIFIQLEYINLNLFDRPISTGTTLIDLVIRILFLIVIQFIFFVTLSNVLPSITAQGKFFNALKENFKVIRYGYKRLIVTWGLFFLIFSIPSITFLLIMTLLFRIFFSSVWAFLGILQIFFLFVGVFIGYPVMSLISTRIYKNTMAEINSE